MHAFTKHTGIVMPMDRVNVDTDQITPKQFIKWITREGYGRVLFYDWRYLPGEKPNPDFVLNFPRYKGASVMLARANFGCGSSREHAPWSLADYGFRAIIAPSYADIFYNNCFQNGILPVILPEAQVEELFRKTESTPGYQLTVDLPEQTVTDADGLRFPFEVNAFRKHSLLEGLDETHRRHRRLRETASPSRRAAKRLSRFQGFRPLEELDYEFSPPMRARGFLAFAFPGALSLSAAADKGGSRFASFPEFSFTPADHPPVAAILPHFSDRQRGAIQAL
jgi:3-isopropylmalate/(R)-2-methylmalate dehydratase small subunit